MAEEADYYAVLDVAPDADELTIHLAYRRLARLYHPDVAGEVGASRMKRLNVAYQVLRDAEQRRQYDLEHGIRPRAPAPTPPTAPPPRTARPPAPQRSPMTRRGVVQVSAGPLRVLATLEAPDTTPVVALAFAEADLAAGLGLLDGRILLHDLRADESRPLTSFPAQAVGALQELRLSPSGAYAATWGFPLGTHVFRTADGATLWRTAMNAPGGLMDATLLEGPSLPPGVRLAVPDAPLALAADDSFRWADEGKFGTAVYSRPLIGPVNPSHALPVRIEEPKEPGGLLASTVERPDRRWRVRHRVLSADGLRLFSVATGGEVRGERGIALSLHDLQSRSLLGEAVVRRVARIVEPESALTFPFATTPDLAWVAASDFPLGLEVRSLRGRVGHALPAGVVRPDAQIALSPDADRIAIGRATQLEIWSVRDARRLQTWTLGSEITALTFASSLGQQLLGVGLANGLGVLLG